MALVGNYSVLNRNSYRQFAAGVSSGYPNANTPASSWKNRNYSGFEDYTATPVGYLAPVAWVLPMKSGGMATFFQMTATGSFTESTFATGWNLTSTTDFVSNATMTADLALVVNLVADTDFTATGSFTDAQLALVLGMDAALSGSATFTTADLGNILNMSTAFSAAGTLTSNIVSLTYLSANIGGPTELSPEGLANAVWDTVLAEHQTAGSTGKALNDAGAAGNPWSAATSSNNTDGTFGSLVQKLLKFTNFLGLK